MTDRKRFVRANGQSLMDEYGQELVLRGVGLGGWLLPEGYMWQLPAQGDRPRRIEKMIVDLVGENKARLFWKTYYERYTSESDIRRISEEGFNSVRIPINSRFLVAQAEPVHFDAEHLAMLDQVVAWCRIHKLYAILDLHGAPGGQTGTNIDDSEHDLPELFTNNQYHEQTIDIWRMLALRYRDEQAVAGYDLLNEPLPHWFSQYNDLVMPLYEEIIAEIRKIDPDHMIILEGVHWATDWSIFDKRPDANIMLEFHKYWNNPDIESIQAFIDKGSEWKVPVFMGEGGENNLNWYAGAFRLFEDCQISWNFWTWKKMGNNGNSPCIVKMPNDWHVLSSYLEGGEKPSAETAERVLWEFLDSVHLDNCRYHPEVIHAIFQRAPVLIPAIFYGYKGHGISCGGKSTNQIDFRKHDGTKICFANAEAGSLNFQHMAGEEWKDNEWLCVELAQGDWVSYDFTVSDATKSLLAIQICLSSAEHKGRISIIMDGVVIGFLETQEQGWEVAALSAVLDIGSHRITLQGESNQVRVKWIDLK